MQTQTSFAELESHLQEEADPTRGQNIRRAKDFGLSDEGIKDALYNRIESDVLPLNYDSCLRAS